MAHVSSNGTGEQAREPRLLAPPTVTSAAVLSLCKLGEGVGNKATQVDMMIKSIWNGRGMRGGYAYPIRFENLLPAANNLSKIRYPAKALERGGNHISVEHAE